MIRTQRFWWVFAVITLLIAGGLSYLASSSPDGLDSATLRGCEVVETATGEELRGDCIARHADEHPLAGSPFADYAVTGAEGTGGLAGVIGVGVTLLIAGGVFWLIARGRKTSKTTAGD